MAGNHDQVVSDTESERSVSSDEEEMSDEGNEVTSGKEKVKKQEVKVSVSDSESQTDESASEEEASDEEDGAGSVGEKVVAVNNDGLKVAAALNKPRMQIQVVNTSVKRPVEEMGQHDTKRSKHMMSGRDVTTLMGTEVGGYCGLDESKVSQLWATQVDEEEKRKLGEKLKALKDARLDLHTQQSQLKADVTKVIVEALKKQE